MRIEITKWRVYARLYNGQIMEQSKSIIDKYYEEERDQSSDPALLSDQKRKFIDKVVKNIAGMNRTQEEMFKRDPTKAYIKLIVSNVL